MFDFLDVEELKEGVAEYGGKERGKWLKFWGKVWIWASSINCLQNSHKIIAKNLQKIERKYSRNQVKNENLIFIWWSFQDLSPFLHILTFLISKSMADEAMMKKYDNLND